MSQYVLVQDDIAPLLEGLAILGTGGGGSPSWGKAIMEQDLAMGRTLTIIPLGEISDDATVVSGGMMGSVKVLEAMGIEGVIDHWEERFELLEVTRVMEGILGRKVDHVVPFEVGGLNTPVILSLGARMGIPVIDGDALGRSAPETQMTSFIGHGISLTPMPLIDYEGNVVIVQEATEPTYADELGRWVVTKGGGMGANNHYPMTGRQAKEAIVPNTISGALDLGRTVFRARQEGDDPVAAVDLRGMAQDEGRTARLVIKNETMLLSIDDAIKAIFPDLVCMLQAGTGRGVMSVELRPGTSLALVGVRCHQRLREALDSEVGAIAFSPARYGRPELEYLPIETLVEGFD